MSVTVNRNVLEAAKNEAAQRLQRAAVLFFNQHVRRQSRSNPLPYLKSSRPGEYLRQRTGAGNSGVIWGPKTPAEIIAGGFKVRIGQLENTLYMLWWELRKDTSKRRLGFLRTLEDLRARLRVILGTKS